MWPRVNGRRALELGSAGSMRDELNGLVLAGDKVATAGLLSEYAEENEEFEHVGEQLALLDNTGEQLAVVVVTGLDVRRFADVPWEFAQAEGEGYTDIEHWRESHHRFWTQAEGRDITPETQIVCVHFRLADAPET